jgi:hypothetical protein
VILKPLIIRSIMIIRPHRSIPKTARMSHPEMQSKPRRSASRTFDHPPFEPMIPIAKIQAELNRPQFCKNQVASALAFAA